MDEQYKAFANRFRKMWKHNSKWARRKGIEAFRIYDVDLPDFPLAIDRYKDKLHVSEYQRFDDWTEEQAEEWWWQVRAILCEITGFNDDDIHVKVRRRQKGKKQYEKLDDSHYGFWVTENELHFWINLQDYLDSGLFLDHRNTRQMVREQSAGKRVLNLFAYTGSFSVYAAAGGASHITTVDLSNTYLDWAQANMQKNGFKGDQYEFIQADVINWLRQTPDEKYDIIVLDPPTFSNSKRMRDILDVQRDHVHLIFDCIDWLSPNGKLIFSTNFRKFRLDERALAQFDVKEITNITVPQDFRNKKIHRCFEIKG